MTDKNLYSKDSIESLNPREHVQLRSGVYCGDTSNPNQLLVEIFSNALDEYNINHGDKIIVNILQNNVCEVEDCGQGFPINEMREDGHTILEAAYSVMNTSGKFSDDGVYGGSSLGLNGMGAKLTNFLSDWFEVTSWQKGKFEQLRFEDGLLVKRETGEWKDKNKSSGTYVKYLPGTQFFDSIKTDKNYFEEFFNDMACLCPGLKIIFNGETIEHSSIEELIDRKLNDEIEIINSRLVIEHKEKAGEIDLAMSFCGKSSPTIISYVNYGLTTIGPHITAIKSTITRVFNNWAKENGLLKKADKNLDGAAIQEGMLLVSNLVTKNVAYNAQVKSTVTKIDSSFATTELASVLEIWLDSNPEDAKNIINKALVARKAAEAAKKAREAVKNKANVVTKKDKALKLPTTLSDAWSKDRSKCELFICEGKSAASGLVAARDSETQAIYGVRGKMLSVLKTSPDKIVKNQEINNILEALGLEYNKATGKAKYDKNKLRYGKIVAAADADFDGFAIENLLFNILWYVCPDLIIEGHVYSAVPPLYRVTTKNNEYVYLRDDQALEEYKKTNGSKIATLGRMKGLGEQDSDELSYCLLEPETRNLYQLEVKDIGATEKMFQDLYGKAVTPRVQFLAKHSEEANVID